MSIDVSFLGASSASGTTGTSSTGSKELDKQAFLNLLVAQLRNQDPSSPMDTSQMMTQTTQLSTMEALQELATTQREAFALQMRSAAADLIGKHVAWTDADGVDHDGVVASVSYTGAVPTVKVGDEDLPLDVVAGVTATPTA